MEEPLFRDAAASFEAIRDLLGWSPPSPTRPRRPADDIWDALCAALKWTPELGDVAGSKRIGRATKALCDAHASPADVRERASRYRQVMPTVMLTPESLVKHWSALAAPPRPAPREVAVKPEDSSEPIADLAGAARDQIRRLQGAMDARASVIRQD